jgi:UDP-4-amino-4,6-dideoxy-N-acetyl-beta-L-altrosamine N-acetyltransferase
MKYKKFQDLSLEEKQEVLNWRNHPDIRKWMYNKEEISLQNHLEFINKLPENKIYLKIDDLGVVNFLITKDYVDIGIHKNPNKKKVGKKLFDFAINYAFNKLNAKKIILCVFENNTKAINLYKKFGCKEIQKKDNLIKMELNYEDWKNRYRKPNFYNCRTQRKS